jgi:hypothetical protein
MRFAIDLDGQFLLGTKEVEYKNSGRVLAPKLEASRTFAQFAPE